MKAKIKAAWAWIKANKGLVARVTAIVVVAGNSVAAVLGYTTGDVTSDQVYSITTSALTIAGFGLATEKNFNFTSAAQTAQGVLDALKDGKITADEVESLLSGVEKVMVTSAATVSLPDPTGQPDDVVAVPAIDTTTTTTEA
jgi:hypothetical protein